MYGNLSFFIVDSSAMSEEKLIKRNMREHKSKYERHIFLY